MINLEKFSPPAKGERIRMEPDRLQVPDRPVIPFIEGDGIGPDIMRAGRRVLDAAVEKAYGNERELCWYEIYAGEKAHEKYGEWIPNDTFEALHYYSVALKGPLTTPIGGGFRSLNVTLRQKLDLYACVRPVRYFEGVPAPVKEPWKMNMIIFRENTEDVYSGIEWARDSEEAKKVISFLNNEMGCTIRTDSGIGIKPVSETGSKRLIRKAIQYALDRKRKSVTLVHKGNIMKYTEGAFRDWGYEVAREEFPDQTLEEKELQGEIPEGRVLINDRIADAMFQQILTRTDEYSVLATLNLNGDYLSDACAAQIGGLGLAPGANIGETVALFEATHGTAPKYAGQDKVNPGSLILSGVMMLEHLGWEEAGKVVVAALEETIRQKRVTYDLERQMKDAVKLSTSQFAEAIVKNMKGN
ncbi:MAG: isocitrate dehydrogenase (NADP(+)) [Deltaproteobacteria bacterium]|nr:isocitrate dehydrogenase (NADP(+)) [Deltaproteobacteria bacterium]